MAPPQRLEIERGHVQHHVSSTRDLQVRKTDAAQTTLWLPEVDGDGRLHWE
jgi:hypothetical protein